MSWSTQKRSPLEASTAWKVVAAALLAVVVAAVVGGCGSGGSPGTTGSAGATTTLPPIEHKTGASDLILQVSTSGFTALEVTSTPDFSLYGDGRVIITGPVIAIYPGPALPNLQTTVITEAEIQSVLHAAQDAGLLRNKFDYGRPGVTDMGTTKVVVNAADKTYTSEIYALGSEEDAGGVTDAQGQARAQVTAFNQKLSTLSGFTTRKLSWTGYQYTSLAVYIRQIAATTSATSTDVQPNTLAWPLGDLATLGQPAEGGYRKLLVSGQELSTLSPLLADATEITEWTSNGKTYNLSFRPLLPGQNQ